MITMRSYEVNCIGVESNRDSKVMGYSISWLAVQTDNIEEVLSSLSLDETSDKGTYIDYPIVGQMLPNGWYLMVSDQCDDSLFSDKKFRVNINIKVSGNMFYRRTCYVLLMFNME